jgi:hypothetical protein
LLSKWSAIGLQEAPNSKKVWRNRKNEPLYAGSSTTVLVAAMEALQEKRTNGIGTNSAFNRQCKRIARLLPQPNHYPPSLYSMKQVVGAEGLESYMVHTCVNDCVRFDQLPKENWVLHKDERWAFSNVEPLFMASFVAYLPTAIDEMRMGPRGQGLCM